VPVGTVDRDDGRSDRRAVETRLNGEVVQRGSTADLAFGVATLIEYITTFMTLLPGDVLLTGTPEGVGRLATATSSRSRSTASDATQRGDGAVTEVRCRFAPAPSGSLHVGNVRGAPSPGSGPATTAGRSSCVWRTPTVPVTEEAFRGVLEDLRGSGWTGTRGRRSAATTVRTGNPSGARSAARWSSGPRGGGAPTAATARRRS
jgi:hypothetical protein